MQRCLRDLLSPLEHVHADKWRSSMNRSVGEILGADIVSFQLPFPGVAFMYSDDIDPVSAQRYRPSIDSHDRMAPGRMAELGVCNRAMLWGDGLRRYYASAYYNEFIVPARGFDMLGAAAMLAGYCAPATLYLHHSTPRMRRFGERGLRLLEMLRPALSNWPRATAEIGLGSRLIAAHAGLLEGGDASGGAGIVILLREDNRSALASSGSTGHQALSGREAQVAQLLALGLTNREVALRLGISANTVRHHVERVLRKLSVRSRSDVADELRQPGLRQQ
jgi:DNA-binding CsgD family transcriptional regulator